MIKKYKWKCRVLLVKTPNYKYPDYIDLKKTYQKDIKKFHKRTIKLISKIEKKGFSINLIDFDGKKKIILRRRINSANFFKLVDKIRIPKSSIRYKLKPMNLSLFSDYNPKTTTPGLGYKDKAKAIYTVRTIKNRNLKYQVNVIATMLGRAKKHRNQTKGMREAISIFNRWMINYKKKL